MPVTDLKEPKTRIDVSDFATGTRKAQPSNLQDRYPIFGQVRARFLKDN